MNKHQAQVAAALLERMGMKFYPPSRSFPYVMRLEVIDGEDCWAKFDPYENDSDCWMVVDWMVQKGWRYGLDNRLSTKPGINRFALFNGSAPHLVTKHDDENRRTAITECAAEALGIGVSDE